MIRTVLICAAFAAGASGQTVGGRSADRIDVPSPSDSSDLYKVGKTASVENLPRLCPQGDYHDDDLKVDNIRAISDRWAANGNPSSNRHGFTNMMWAFGQFIDHDIVGTLEDTDSPAIEVPGVPGRVMNLRRAKTVGHNRRPPSVHTSLIDGGAVYGEDREYEKTILREPNSCRLRESIPGFLPISSKPDASGVFRFIAGDSRVDEHSVLTLMHTLWMREHNRLCDSLNSDPRTERLSNWRKYKMVKSTVIAKIQQITVNEWLPAFGINKWMLWSNRPMMNNNKLSVEFSVAYRLGHTLIPDQIGGLPVAALFDGQAFYLDQKDGKVSLRGDSEHYMELLLKALAEEPAAEMDGRVSDALRNVLFGPNFQEDLVSRNIFRGRDLNLPSYEKIARCFGVRPNKKVQRETPDMWLGLLREPRGGRPLGPTHRAMMIDQFGRVLFGRRGNWWQYKMHRDTQHFRQEIKRTSMAKIISDNFDVKLKGNAFKL